MAKTTHQHFRSKMASEASSQRPSFFNYYFSCFRTRFGHEICQFSTPRNPPNQAFSLRRLSFLRFRRFPFECFFLILGSLLASFLVPFQPSWGGLGAILWASWGLPGGFLGVSWGFLVESWAREHPKGLLKASGGSPGASGKPPQGLLGVSWGPPKDLLDASCGPPAS
jgi:hypothetical protein